MITPEGAIDIDPAVKALSNMRVLLLGFGREGLSTYHFLRRYLTSARLVAADRRTVAELPATTRATLDGDPDLGFMGGENYADYLGDFDVIFRSPGVPPTLPGLEAARQAGIQITSNMGLFFKIYRGQIVGITGTKGKSTTSSVIFSVLSRVHNDVRLVGNIGRPALSYVEGSTLATFFVAELSSHQLADLRRSPHIAVVQDVVPEHLDYYTTFTSYLAAKANIAKHQTPDDYILYNADSSTASHIAQQSLALHLRFGTTNDPELLCTVEDDCLIYRGDGLAQEIMAVSEVPLRGRFNLLNVMPGIIVGRLYGLPPEVISSTISQFRPLEHRLEFVATVNGVSFYNDSLATVPEATIAALESFTEPVVVIAGGEDRGQDFAQLAQVLRARDIRALILLPPSGERIRTALASDPLDFPRPCWLVNSMDGAVRAAVKVAQPGDCVILSPGSASRNLFRDYADRGEQFRAGVRRIALGIN